MDSRMFIRDAEGHKHYDPYVGMGWNDSTGHVTVEEFDEETRHYILSHRRSTRALQSSGRFRPLTPSSGDPYLDDIF